MKELKRLRTFGLLLEWKTLHINQHHLQYDSNGCPIICYPSQLPEATLFESCQKEKPKCCDCCGEIEKPPIGGWIQRFNCLHINIKPAITNWGHWPVNRFPDGISYMEVNGNTGTCSPNIFEVSKLRNIYTNPLTL